MKTLSSSILASALVALALILPGCSDIAKPTDSETHFAAAKPSTGPSCVAPPAGLVSWWPGDGDASDIIGGNEGSALYSADFVPGKVGSAFRLDGVDDRVQVADSPSLDITGDITLDAWFRSDGPNGGMIINKENPAGPVRTGYALHVNPPFPASSAATANSVAVNFFSPTGDHVGVNSRVSGDLTNYNDGVFHHIAGTYSVADGVARLYVDGQLLGTSTQASIASIGTNDLPLIIGARDGSPLPFAGLIDEVEIFNRALSAAEIQGIFNAGSAGKCKNPVDKQDCKDGGWEQFGFRNQGQCVRFVETGKDSR